MCTVSFVPINDNQWVLTSNRDESPKRSPKAISKKEKTEQTLIYPQDIKGGTWIAASNKNRWICVLNGAFIKHKHRPPYPRSRGLIALDIFDYPSIHDFYNNYDLRGIEPFTMVVWEHQNLYQFRRDEEQSYLTPLDIKESYIWSSSPLYNQVAKIKRQHWFDEWKKATPQPAPKDILHLHQTGGDGDIYNDYVMNRQDIVKTVSITQIICTNTNIQMHYNDLLNNQSSSSQIKLLSGHLQ